MDFGFIAFLFFTFITLSTAVFVKKDRLFWIFISAVFVLAAFFQTELFKVERVKISTIRQGDMFSIQYDWPVCAWRGDNITVVKDSNQAFRFLENGERVQDPYLEYELWEHIKKGKFFQEFKTVEKEN